ncbi:flagellin [Sphingomonas sp. S-NIH.Pt15_0812]|jgi:flagellar hook-associated protein 3 FlgL|uniref:flagellin n=1 Tax=Sphingomonas sp. S-NIH.Pt15_0812 TaxID=1920129 RepID=UPI000F7F4D5B|nr:flagellin [Sphingomonas sp. S-NIH.Pt15_0812]RSU53886.1 flagellin [Sphingomonas sp. S-NIH.Pt15_0812]
MTRIATIPLQQAQAAGMARATGKLNDVITKLSSGKKAPDLAGLGSDAVRSLSTRNMLARQEAQGKAASQLGTTLSLYATNIGAIDESVTSLRTALLTAAGTGDGTGVQGAIAGAFQQVRNALNASDGEVALFAGSQTQGTPFKPVTLADTVGATTATAFADDGVRASARVGDAIDVTYGVSARELGGDLLQAFRTLAEAGDIGSTPTAAQKAAMQSAAEQIQKALSGVRSIDGENGRKQALLESLGTRAAERSTLLKGVIADAEDADYAQLSTELDQQQQVLKASYSVFSQVSKLSLTDYIR